MTPLMQLTHFLHRNYRLGLYYEAIMILCVSLISLNIYKNLMVFETFRWKGKQNLCHNCRISQRRVNLVSRNFEKDNIKTNDVKNLPYR